MPSDDSSGSELWEALRLSEEDLYPVLPSPRPAVPGANLELNSNRISRPLGFHRQRCHRQSRTPAAFYSSEPEHCWQPYDESETEWECVSSSPPTVQRRETPSRLELRVLDVGYLRLSPRETTASGKPDSESISGTRAKAGSSAQLKAEAAKTVAVTVAGQRAKQSRHKASHSAGSAAAAAAGIKEGWTAVPPTGRASSRNPPSRSSMSAAAAAVKKSRSQTAQQLLSGRNNTGNLSASLAPSAGSSRGAGPTSGALAHWQRSRTDGRYGATISDGSAKSEQSHGGAVSARHSHCLWQAGRRDASSSTSETPLGRATRVCEQYLRILEEHLG